jgi:hypothetical protein
MKKKHFSLEFLIAIYMLFGTCFVKAKTDKLSQSHEQFFK